MDHVRGFNGVLLCLAENQPENRETEKKHREIQNQDLLSQHFCAYYNRIFPNTVLKEKRIKNSSC